ncbi:MAG: glutamate-5-semialdehyde dehydrogenase [Eubacteriaceae bacterium]|jgi:glutamate-5-semialdehyde dehydrogenase|nr:glutamate-5-semialdehyde dehydrogenase [Eubacteriaceae bacterium]
MSELTMQEKGMSAKKAAITLSALDESQRNEALKAIAEALNTHRKEIAEANRRDIARSKEEQLAAPLLSRLIFDYNEIDGVIEGIASLITLPDPLGHITLATELDEGLDLYRVTSPIGVIGVIFESRPDAFVQIATLCLKSGNAILLKGGREALETNRILYEVISEASEKAGVPHGWIQNMESRDEVTEMLALSDCIDLIIPRGSNEFVKYIMDHSNIPVMGHSDGICHLYIDGDADLEKALAIAVDSKTQYIAACNTLETLLVHRDVASRFLPEVFSALQNKGVEVRGDEAVRNIVPTETATEEDFKTEYLDLILSIKVVDHLQDAIDHINTYGSGHTDAIVTENTEAQKTFLALVDSACVFVNCSTRFSDGFRFGFGAEVGISTSKIHARGPVGLDGLISYKYQLIGHGDRVAPYADGEKTFTHRPLENKKPF